MLTESRIGIWTVYVWDIILENAREILEDVLK